MISQLFWGDVIGRGRSAAENGFAGLDHVDIVVVAQCIGISQTAPRSADLQEVYEFDLVTKEILLADDPAARNRGKQLPTVRRR